MFIEIEDSTFHMIFESTIADGFFKECIEECGLEMEEEFTKDAVWQRLSTHWDFINISLLKHLAHKFGDESLQASIRDYSKKLEAFLSKTAISSFASYSVKIGNNLQDGKFSDIIIEVHQPSFILFNLQTLRESLIFNLRIPKYSLVLQNIKIETNYFTVKWAIPTKIALSLKAEDIMKKAGNKSLCKMYQIGSITIDDRRYLTMDISRTRELAPGRQSKWKCVC